MNETGMVILNCVMILATICDIYSVTLTVSVFPTSFPT
jgi:hypothetical protein